MAVDSVGSDFSDLLRRTMGALRPVASPEQQDVDTEEIRGQGESAEGMVTVIVAPGGRVESVAIAPHAMRMASQTLGEEIAAATNAAMDDLQSKIREATAAATVDLDALGRRLEEIQQTSAARMQTFLRAITDTQGAGR